MPGPVLPDPPALVPLLAVGPKPPQPQAALQLTGLTRSAHRKYSSAGSSWLGPIGPQNLGRGSTHSRPNSQSFFS
jgi:hypothetical protein